MKRKIGILFCIMLLISMTFAVAAGENIQTKNDKIKISLNNSPPSNPILTAPNIVIKNRVFIIKAISNDPDSDQIYYRFKFGEDSTPRSWNGPFNSGYEFKLRVGLLGYSGDLVIGFQAKDINEAKSDWTYFTVTYTNYKSRTFVFANLLSLFPQLSQIFKL